MMDSFVGWIAGGRNRTAAALSSKRALLNDNGRADDIPCARWDTLDRRYVFSTHSMFSWTTDFTLPFVAVG